MFSFAAIFSAFALGQSFLCANLLLARVHHRSVYLPLALFFSANVVTEASTIFDMPSSEYVSMYWQHLLSAASVFTDVTLAPLFWLYVRALTSEKQTNWQPQDSLHFIPAAIGLITFILVIVMPESERTDLFSSERDRASTWQTILFVLIVGLYFVTISQICCYVVAISHRLVKYRARLMDLFASTAHLELRWISGLIFLLGGYGLFTLISILVDVFSEISIPEEPLASILNVTLIWTLAVWGLRQRPELADEVAQIEKQIVAVETKTIEEAPTTPVKYEKSALAEDHIDRIANKIETAMQSDALYRNPDLSLRILSNQIGVVPNYVSQALNTKLGETFFDYINSWRVKEAMTLLAKSDDTVLNISLAAGFNSRSSFYSAFKKVTGKTPSAYRQDQTTNTV